MHQIGKTNNNGGSYQNITEDHANKAVGEYHPGPADAAVGPQLGYTIPTLRLSFNTKYLYKYMAEDRFRGHALTASVAYQF
jgi:hypothetical protein